MPDGFAAFRAEMERWRRAVRQAAAQGVAQAMPALQAAARATDIYHDDTGATRGSTVAYAVAGDGSVDQSASADAALAYADERNPGSGSDDESAVDVDEVAGFLSAFTFYAEDLEQREGGFIGVTMDAQAAQIHASVEAALRKVAG